MDPGFTPYMESDNMFELNCNICKQTKPPRSHHCKRCKRCVHRMDHHCPWINNCIGYNNQKYFVQFLFYTFLVCCFGINIGLGVAYVYFERNLILKEDDRYVFGFLAFGISIGVVFLLLSGIMLFDQLNSLILNQTKIEKKKKIRGITRSILQNFKNILGKSVFDWVLPIEIDVEADFLEQVKKETNSSSFFNFFLIGASYLFVSFLAISALYVKFLSN